MNDIQKALRKELKYFYAAVDKAETKRVNIESKELDINTIPEKTFKWATAQSDASYFWGVISGIKMVAKLLGYSLSSIYPEGEG